MSQADLFNDECAPSGYELEFYDAGVVNRARGSEFGAGENTLVRTYIKRLQSSPRKLSLPPPPSLGALEQLGREFEHAGELISVLQKYLALAHLPPGGPFTPPPLLLEGPPGIGKTYLVRRLAEALFTDFWEFSFSHSNASFSLGGLDAQYHGGGPGWLVRAAIDTAYENTGRLRPLVLLDEIDKAPRDGNSDPLGPLFSLLESHSAEKFTDDGFRVPINLSWLSYIATANDTSHLNPALLSRFRVVELPLPTAEQRARIARRLLVKELLSNAWGSCFEPVLANDVVDALEDDSTRDLRHTLREALGAAALRNSTRIQLCDLPRRKIRKHRHIGFVQTTTP